MKIMVIDDKDDARYFLEVLLKSKGYDVLTADSGKTALDKLENTTVDLIISDILMPDMDGFKFCRIVKATERLKDIPFIFYTATYVDKKDKEFALGLGADLFLIKPMEPGLLIEKIETLLKTIIEGKYKPQEGKLQNEKDIYKLYNERLIKKLEHKIGQLEEEIERRTEAEAKLVSMVEEKEILLKELYHRTRNNMQVIISMLRLYSTKLFDERWNENAIEDIISKIRTMALVHHKLYESQDLSHVNLRDYFESMIEMLKEAYARDLKKCTLEVEFDEMKVLLDTAIPLGFILNELIVNACEHAFQEDQDGKVDIKLYKNENNQMVLCVEDNGRGLPEGFDLQSKDNIGLLIITSMIDKQLKGKLEYRNENGLKWKVIIDEEVYSERV